MNMQLLSVFNPSKQRQHYRAFIRIVTHAARIVSLLAIALPISAVQAHSGSECNPVDIKPKSAIDPIYLHENPALKTLGKRWSTSAALKKYFDQQRALLPYLTESFGTVEPDSIVTFGAVGDLMRLSNPQGRLLEGELGRILSATDIVTGNLETLISPKYPVPPKHIMEMNSAPDAISGFVRSDGKNAFTAVSTANNHTFDFPDDAITDTLDTLETLGVAQSGILKSQDDPGYVAIESNGVKVGYYALTTFVNVERLQKESRYSLTPMIEGIKAKPFEEWQGSCEIDLKKLEEALWRMKKDGMDMRIVSIHWGVEHDLYPQSVQLDLAHRIVAMGADIIVGAHPHVAQPAEVCFVNGYENQLPAEIATRQPKEGCTITTEDGNPRKAIIYYSLGNFTSYTPFFMQQAGVLAQLNIGRYPNGDSYRYDWFNPKYTLTYDYVPEPPHGKHSVNTLDAFIKNNCETGCDKTQLFLAERLQRHLTGQSLSTWEELGSWGLTTYHSLWELFSSGFFSTTVLNDKP